MDNTPHTSPFEAIRKVNDDGNEYWSARDLSKILGYTEWRNFTTAIEKAKEACHNSGQAVSDHFVETNKMINLAKGAKRKVNDYNLSLRFAHSRKKHSTVTKGRTEAFAGTFSAFII